MNIVILHHHFHSGGVLQVVLGHLLGLAKVSHPSRPARVVLVHGGRNNGLQKGLAELDLRGMPVDEVIVPGLEYDDRRSLSRPSGTELAGELEHALESNGLDRNETVLHVHNATLGRNVALPPAIAQLAVRGWYWLSQIHDFAEDLRPQNLLSLIHSSGAKSPEELQQWLYPQSPRIHYTTLVTRDLYWLLRSGLDPSAGFVTPNPVIESAENSPSDRGTARAIIADKLHFDLSEDAAYFLYPVRGIRRKNVGEVLLWASLLEAPAFFSITLEPTTFVETQSWRRWQRWSAELELPIYFGSGHIPGVSLSTNRAAADAVISTSVAEGFGMAFLEPWLQARPVIGRNLENATADFRAAGMQFPLMYERVMIPCESEQAEAWSASLATMRDTAWAGLPDTFRAALLDTTERSPNHAHVVRDQFDFASLTPADQIDVLQRINSDRGYRDTVQSANAETLRYFTSDLLAPKRLESVMQDNQRILRDFYAPKTIGSHLVARYRMLLSGDTSELASGEPADLSTRSESGRSDRTVLHCVANAAEFYPLRTEAQVIDRPFARLHRRLSPRKTDVSPQLTTLPDIRAIIFDIYGTLVISGSGDVGSADCAPRESALREACETLGLRLQGTDAEGIQRQHRYIAEAQEKLRASGVDYPEIHIVDIWDRWLREGGEALSGVPSTPDTRRALARRLAAEFEARANPCDTMPGAANVLIQLKEAGFALGIVSNAQAFTPDVVAESLGQPWDRLGFELDLTLFSFRFAHAKPGITLFHRLCAALKRRGISPHQAIYIGNDMLNDVMAAGRAGLRTALFAGDERSLRMRENDSRVAEVAPDIILTELSQLPDVVTGDWRN